MAVTSVAIAVGTIDAMRVSKKVGKAAPPYWGQPDRNLSVVAERSLASDGTDLPSERQERRTAVRWSETGRAVEAHAWRGEAQGSGVAFCRTRLSAIRPYPVPWALVEPG